MTAEDNLITRWRKNIEFFEALRYAAAENGGSAFSTKSLLQLTDDFEGMLGGTQFGGIDSDLFAARAIVSQALDVAETTFARHVFDYKSIQGFAGNTFSELWPQLFRYYAENNRRVASRGFVFQVDGGSAAGPSPNVGNGGIRRLNVDAFGFTLEAQTPDSKLLRCERDSTTGTNIQEEEFSIKSITPVGRDLLDERGSGKIGEKNFAGISARTTTNFRILNPSFSDSTPAGPTAAPTELGGWGSNVPISGTNYEVINDYYRGSFGDDAPMALRCKALAFILSQTLSGEKFDLETGYYRHIAVRRKASADGTITLRLGRGSTTVNLTSLVNDVWTIIRVDDLDPSAWARNFAQPSMQLQVERSGGATVGYFDIDDITVGAFGEFDGGLWAVVGGSIAFQVEDTLGFVDSAPASAAGASVNQDWFWRQLGLYLPSCPPSPAAAPTDVLAGAGAGNVDNGTHVYVKTWVDQRGLESGPSAVSAVVTVVDKTTNGKVTVGRGEGFPNGSITAWRIYRSKAGTVTPLFFVGISAGASFTDNVADASLPATQPPAAAVTFRDPP